ncbi:Uncharacterised protein [Vibrio cholerae]|nr:Uncharacterised protein [Vibrio cholerae]CSC93735.1 Uncharacterised protein [Vibrio cholerae]CSD30505.1 Uncharacterised protein [Vibrio cholerae]
MVLAKIFPLFDFLTIFGHAVSDALLILCHHLQLTPLLHTVNGSWVCHRSVFLNGVLILLARTASEQNGTNNSE